MNYLLADGAQGFFCQPCVSYRGIAGVSRYDPHSPRCFEGIKLNLFENRPVILRLHSAANYPNGDYRFQIDQEGHAIILVGYDDDAQAFAVVDPFQRVSGVAVVTWLPYEDLALTMVDASLGTDVTSSGLSMDVSMSKNYSALHVSIGLPKVYGIIMDHDLFVLEEISIDVTLKCCGKVVVSRHASDEWCFVGSQARFEISLPIDFYGDVEVFISADGVLHGMRPYEYRDVIGVDFESVLVLERQGEDCQVVGE